MAVTKFRFELVAVHYRSGGLAGKVCGDVVCVFSGSQANHVDPFTAVDVVVVCEDVSYR